MKSFTHTIQDAMGIHARPAGMLSKEAAKYNCTIQLQCEDRDADAKRVFSVMALEARCGDTLQITCTGEDEDTAAQEYKLFLVQHL